MYLLIRWCLNALALIVASYLIVGVQISSFYTALVVALLLGFLNAIVRPLIIILTLPVTFLTLGLFLFVINALLIWFASSIIKGFEVAGFLPALWLGLFLWSVGVTTNWFFERRTRI